MPKRLSKAGGRSGTRSSRRVGRNGHDLINHRLEALAEVGDMHRDLVREDIVGIDGLAMDENDDVVTATLERVIESGDINVLEG